MLQETVVFHVDPDVAFFLGQGYANSCIACAKDFMDEKSRLDIFSREVCLRTVEGPRKGDELVVRFYMDMIAGTVHVYAKPNDTTDHRIFVASLN